MQESEFLLETFTVLCKYQAKVAMGAMEGTVQCTGGQHPYLDESCLLDNFFSQKFPKYFFGKIYMNQKQFDW